MLHQEVKEQVESGTKGIDSKLSGSTHYLYPDLTGIKLSEAAIQGSAFIGHSN